MEDHLRSDGIGTSERAYLNIYPNPCVFSIEIEESGYRRYIEIICKKGHL
jgi:hypothetical protein